MFSPDTSSHNHSLRPKRTRQATGNDDSVKLPQAKRKRSALRRDTFVEPLVEASLNEIAGRDVGQTKTNGHVSDSKAAAAAPVTQLHELSIRSGKKTDKRSERGAGSLVLASNDFYNISQLPSLPDPIRNRPSIPYNCFLSSEYGLALALTHTDGIIWPYNSSATNPSSKDVISFKLPLPPASASDPLPLATFTARSAGREPGILVVSPKWGKVVYWESTTSASAFIPGQTSAGVQGTISGMFSGELVQGLVSAEPSGFILTFNHGRVAHLSVRDQLGRPAIGVQFVRKSSGTTRGGIFGSIRNVFSGDRRKGTPLVRSGKFAKGQRDVVVMTDDADLEVWHTNVSGDHSLLHNTSLKDQLLDSLSPHWDTTSNQHLQFRVLDFELGHAGREIARRDQTTAFPLIVLLSLTKSSSSQYYIVEMLVDQPESVIRTVHPVKCYHEPVPDTQSGRPRLIVSPSQPMAFVILETAVLLFSLARITESPSSQLLMEKQALPDPFQDCISFQQNTIYKVLGYVSEDYDEQVACVIAVQGFGLVRLVSLARNNQEIDVDDYQDGLTTKSKIEQAVFFGTIKQNPFNLSSGSPSEFTAEEIATAALQISSEILSSNSKHLPRGGPSIETQMKHRAKALDDLISHLMKQYSSVVSRNLRYKLLWKAEKLAAAQALWKVQEEIQRRYPLKDREMPYLDFTLRALHESRQKYPDQDRGEKDRVRHWLLNSVENTDHLLSELVDCIKELEPMDVTSPQVIGEYLIEAVDLWIAAYTGAFKFREDQAASYGLDDDIFENGVLVAGYPPTAGIPWTSKPEPIRYASKLIDEICAYLGEWWDYTPESAKSKKKKMPLDLEGKPHAAPPKSLLNELAGRLPREVHLFNSIVTEEIINAIRHEELIQRTPEARATKAAEIRSEKRPRMNEAVRKIAQFSPPGAIELAEDLKDPGLLVGLVTDYLLMLELDSKIHPDNARKNARKILDIQEHAEAYYDHFGNGWAYANFTRKIQNGELGSLLMEAQADQGKKQNYLTWFLKKSAKRGQAVGKLSWINDVIGEQNFSHAEKTLVDVAENEEMNLWNKRTELSLAKLVGLASIEAKGDLQSDSDSKAEAAYLKTLTTADDYDDKLDIVEIQTRLTGHINAAVGATIDDKAAEELAVQIFSKRVTEKSPALRKLLLLGLRGILNQRPLSAEQLVDVLTLIDPIEIDVSPEDHEAPDVVGLEFFLALQVVACAGEGELSSQHKRELRKVIWRRAIVRDDWTILNDTTGLDDEKVEERWRKSSLWITLGNLFIDYKTRTVAGEDINVEEQIISPKEMLGDESSQDVTEGKDTTVPMEEVKEIKESASAKAATKIPAYHLPQVLTERFFGDVKEAEAVRRDMAKEQTRLREFVGKAQLELHFEGLLREAEELTVEEDGVEVDGGDEGAQTQEV